MTSNSGSPTTRPRSSGRFLELLDPLMASPGVARDAYRISLFGNFFNGPIYVMIQKRFGLLRDEINTLFCLAHFSDLTQTDICLVMGRPKNSVSRAIGRLLARNLIAVRDDPTDGRKGVLTLRAEGRELYEETRLLFVEREQKMLASLTKADRVALDRLLTKIMNSHENWSELF